MFVTVSFPISQVPCCGANTGIDNSFDNLNLSAYSHAEVTAVCLGYSYKLMAVSSVEAERVTLVGHGDLKTSMLSPVVDTFKAQWLQALSLHREFKREHTHRNTLLNTHEHKHITNYNTQNSLCYIKF